MQSYYSLETVQDLVDRYIQSDGIIQTISDGVLGLGCIVLSAPGRRFAIITEKFVNPWMSTHTVRFYSKLPKKYLQAIDDYDRSFLDQ